MSHFTQVVWKSTTQLGCGIALCPGLFGNRQGPATYHVCLYDPVGNVVGEEKSVCPSASSTCQRLTSVPQRQPSNRLITQLRPGTIQYLTAFARSDSSLLPRSGNLFHGLFIASIPGVVGRSYPAWAGREAYSHSRYYAVPFHMGYL